MNTRARARLLVSRFISALMAGAATVAMASLMRFDAPILKRLDAIEVELANMKETLAKISPSKLAQSK